MYDHILLPTDGCEHSVRAAEHARGLARAFDATLHVVTVLDLAAAAGPFDAGGLDAAYVERLEAAGREAVDAVADAVGSDAELRTAVVRGRPAEGVLAYADEHDVDLIAMGTHGRTGIDRYVTGSVTERVLRRADVPVLTVRATDRSRVTDGYDDVLVPTDGTDAADVAVEHAVAVAAASGARLRVVSVVDVRAAAATPDVTPPAALVEELEAASERAVEAVAARAREAGLETTTEVRTGSPARDLLAAVDEHDVDLVAMGTHGRRGLGRYLLGSTTEKLVRRCDVPVLAVPAGNGASEA